MVSILSTHGKKNSPCPRNTTHFTETGQDVLAYFDHPRTSNGPTEAVNGRLEHLRGIALGFRNLAHYTIRSLIHTGRLKDHLTETT